MRKKHVIDISPWYNQDPPIFKKILFVQGINEVAFVDKTGHTRCLSLTTSQFRAASINFSPNAKKILSTPEGSCLVSIISKKSEALTSTNADTELLGEDKEITDGKEITFAEVYFLEKFGEENAIFVELKDVQMEMIDSLSFTTIGENQVHLMMIDPFKLVLKSFLVIITVEKSQWRLRENEINIGRVKIDKNKVIGRFSKFLDEIRPGDSIIIKNEKRAVLNVISNDLLECEYNFNQNFENQWLPYCLEKRSNSNLYLECIKLGFEKYPVKSCLESNTTTVFTRTNAGTIILVANSMQDKIKKFRNYFSRMIEELKNTTKKDCSWLGTLSLSVMDFESLKISDVCNLMDEIPLSDFLVGVCCLVPIQISVTDSNRLIPLKDGISNEACFQNQEITEIASAISFGWFESVFTYFGNYKIKVVSTMGEQSVGKSYMLNALIPTHFEGNAMVRRL
ncbi:hypothetical protein HK096_002475 [Nowakowskiella sp. JEL0078]|nr:hypothetical protein HK096_002475 [Nowakowskiella sp. JEL0078]